MADIGFIIFGRPVKHEYVSNGLFNDLGLSGETYLDEKISLEKNQTIAILKRYRDNNGFEVVTVYLNTYAISYNDRSGGFIGAGIAFVGKPSVKLIYNKLAEIYRQSLNLINPDTAKFIEPRIQKESISLPDPNDNGLLDNNKPKKYNLQNDITIGVKVAGNFHENLMSVIQGFVNNESFYGVKTAYVTKHQELFKNLVNPKYIYGVQHLLDYSRAFQNYQLRIEKSLSNLKQKQSEFDFKVKQKSDELQNKDTKINNKLQELDIARDQINREIKDKVNRKQSLTDEIEETNRRFQSDLRKKNNLGSEIKKLQYEITKLKNEKFNNFTSLINSNEFSEELKSYNQNLIQNYEIQKREKKGLTDWFKIFLFATTILFFSTTLILGFLYFKKSNYYKLSSQPTYIENEDLQEEENQSIELKIPKEILAGKFLEMTETEKEKHKSQLDITLSLLNDDKYKSSFNNYELLSNRDWNFREVLDPNVRDDIDKGLQRLVLIKKLKGIKDTTLFYSPRFLISKLQANGNEIESKKYKKNTKNISDLLKQYLEDKSNIYDRLKIKYNKPGNEKVNFQDSDPILLMHFRWMAFNYKNQKIDIQKLKKGKSIQLPNIKK